VPDRIRTAPWDAERFGKKLGDRAVGLAALGDGANRTLSTVRPFASTSTPSMPSRPPRG